MFVSVFSWFFFGYIFGVSLRLLLEEFAFLRDGLPAWFALGNLYIISTSSSYDVADGFFCRDLRHFSRSSSFLESSLDRHAVF